MKRTIPVVALVLGACSQPDAQAPAVTEVPPPPPGYVIETAPPPPPPGYVVEKAPTKDEYVADQSAAIEFNRQQEAKREAQIARDDAEWRADRRTDRIVEAQEETRRAVERVEDKL